MHTFTSITANYIPKARVLAESVKRHQPDAQFHLVLSDRQPDGFDIADEPFDSVISIDDLPIENREGWIFSHSVVEVCTAVKGIAFQEIHRRHGADKVIFFDPDMVVFSSLNVLSDHLDNHAVLLTPHQTEPEESQAAILDNEMCSLQHGVFNLGFLAVNFAKPDGVRFIDWWARRLIDYCYDAKELGLFTDQRWVDLAPCFFDDIKVLRDPEFNVATWNLTHRVAEGTLREGIRINGRPLVFYHFSGFDSGAQEIMLKVYGHHSPVLKELREWYIARCGDNGQQGLGKTPSIYGCFDNGERITPSHRKLYRLREDLQRAFPNPFRTDDINRSYYDWYRVNVAGGAEDGVLSDQELELQMLRGELNRIKSSLSWRLCQKVRGALRRTPA